MIAYNDKILTANNTDCNQTNPKTDKYWVELGEKREIVLSDRATRTSEYLPLYLED